jgi:hypothetical protein
MSFVCTRMWDCGGTQIDAASGSAGIARQRESFGHYLPFIV